MNYRIAIVAASLAVSGSALAVIDFDDINIGGDRANFPALGIENTYRGHQWPSTGGNTQHWAAVNNSDSQFATVGARSGAQAGWNWSGPLQLDILFSQDMVVRGAWFNVFMAGQNWGADTILMRGYDASNNLVGSTSLVTLDDVNAAPAWQLSSGLLTGVRKLSIVSTQADTQWGNQGWWTIDDLDVEPVPEPATLAVLAGGALFTLFRRKR